jgi:predicted nucleotidyltransferase component of viral defense system
MIKKEELIKLQKGTGLLLSTIEKDYVLGLLIWSFTQNRNLNTQWIFKGGTCLKKCYFKDYRFSEDLDYTVVPEAPIDPAYIHKELSVCSELLLDHFGLRIDVDNIEISPFPDKFDRFIQIKVPYRGPLMQSGSWPRIKLDITQEEIIVDEPISLPLIHHYSDIDLCSVQVKCYSLYEIFSEKLRALVERTRPRDLYDVIHLAELFKTQELNISLFHEIAIKKFKVRHLEFPKSLNQIPKNSIEALASDWESMLSHQVQGLPRIEIYINKLNELFKTPIVNLIDLIEY